MTSRSFSKIRKESSTNMLAHHSDRDSPVPPELTDHESLTPIINPRKISHLKLNLDISGISKGKNDSDYDTEAYIAHIKQILKEENVGTGVTQKLHEALKLYYKDLLFDQISSRTLQNMISSTSKVILEEIYKELNSDMKFILTDIYANYFLQKLFCYLPKECKLIFIDDLIKDFEYISCNSVGTFPLQKIIESITTEENQVIFLKNLSANVSKNGLIRISFNEYGSHVLEKIIIQFEHLEESLSFLYDIILENLVEFSQNPSSLCIVKKIIVQKHYQKESTYRNIFLKVKEKIEKNVFEIVNSQYGTYVIHSIVDVSLLFNKFY